MKRIGLIVLVFGAVLCFGLSTGLAQQPQAPQQPGSPPPPPDLGDAMFSPDMIMQHQRELGLTDAQKTFMRGELNKTAAQFNDLQWQLQDAMEALHETMKATPINEQQALAQLDKVLDTERGIKKLHMGLAIRLKNNLTPDQVQKLQNMRQGPDRRRHGPGGPNGERPDGPGMGGPDGDRRPGSFAGPGGQGGPPPGGRP